MDGVTEGETDTQARKTSFIFPRACMFMHASEGCIHKLLHVAATARSLAEGDCHLSWHGHLLSYFAGGVTKP